MEYYADYRAIFSFRHLRVIPYSFSTGLQNMCLDYYLARRCIRSGYPVLRFYGWKPCCLSLGRHQSVNDVDRVSLELAGYDMVRRPTGGNAIFHSNELTYSFIVPGKTLDHQKLYHMFHDYLKAALILAGYNVTLEEQQSKYSLNQGGKSFACFNRAAFSELRYGDKKLVGSAQRLFVDSLLQHGSILLGPQHLRIVDFLKTDTRSRKEYLKILKDNSAYLDVQDNNEQQIKNIISALCDQFEQKNELQLLFSDIEAHERQEADSYSELFRV